MSQNDGLVELPLGFFAHTRMAYEAVWDISLLTRGESPTVKEEYIEEDDLPFAST